ncbi:Putative myosin tail region-interacting protein Mti1 [Septoria linicola]|uniref:Myosin tail region-interacting protein Mti1 n=1 Tax=Septoria linicola TaxID=215465 RepID=A0A9Q9EMB9_9PEZI|nr:putative myosin tail region-interacting protein Mti1 [Septoria linicola]USW54273.1 Putative myosin tail region-interacting protein Mti1 [Septoria linicola]
MASLFKVKALYEFEAKEDDDLGFPGGQVIDVTEEIDDNWLEGKYIDANGTSQSGIFPREFVEKYEPPVPSRPTRPTRQKQEPVPEPPVTTRAPEPEPELEEERPVPAVPAASKPQPPPVEVPVAASKQDEIRSPQSSLKSPTLPSEPPAAPRPTPAEPATSGAKKPPPPIAAKSNAFRDRIAAFNQPAAAPVAPMVPGGSRSGANTFIKKPFVAPPPMANSYVPPTIKHEPVHKPYIREEDPEIKRRQEEDRAAAEAAGFSADPSGEQQEEDEDAPKPQTLKERIALLQQQQLEQAQRRADGAPQKKEKKAPTKQVSESSEQGYVQDVDAEHEDVEQDRAAVATRQSIDASRERPRVPSTQRKPSVPMSPVPAAPESELVSDGNEADQSAAGETTEDDTGTIGPEDSDETSAPLPPQRTTAAPSREPETEEDDTAEDAEEDEDSMDEETRKRMEIRERMAKMSGGMGMPGMFGAMPLPGAAPVKKRKEKRPSEDAAPTSPPPQQRVPMIPVPGLQRVQSPESEIAQQTGRDAPVTSDDEDVPLPPPHRSLAEDRAAPPPVPKESRPGQERGAPPPVPGSAPNRASTIEPRPVPQPPPHATPLSPGPGSESDDEASVRHLGSTAETSSVETPGPLPIRNASVRGAPPVPGSETSKSPEGRRASYFGIEGQSTTSEKRASRAPPPVPGSPLTSPRPPPPPPPQAAERNPTGLQAEEAERESEYEGDYDTDIASSVKHKDALKAGIHVREPSLDDSTEVDDPALRAPPPPPHANVPRSVPPPPPQAAPRSRPSMDAPRAPPPVPPAASHEPAPGDSDYDPYRYDGTRGPPPPLPVTIPAVAPPLPPPRQPESESSADDADDLYSVTPPRRSIEVPAAAPAQPPPPVRAPPKESLDVHRSNTTARRSMEQPRPSMDNGHIAQDIDLAESTTWWTTAQSLPPSLQNRQGIDILSESEESTTSKRGGRKEVSREVYILYIDYSQTIISLRFDANNPADAQVEQQHRPPPPKLRQDQLEAYWQRFGRNISETVNALGHAKKDTSVGNGSPAALPAELIKGAPQALQPVGNRAYGALVYANLANASTQQFDEIRPGDIVTLRNTRFEGTHGAMKHKYKQEYGSMHVAIVEEWDGTRRAIRAWEQGREKQKVRSEKFRLGDLRSGEVKVWRVVGRDWVEWETSQ